jgi:hypothetical protein
MGGGVEAIVEIVAIVYYRQKGGFFRQKDKRTDFCRGKRKEDAEKQHPLNVMKTYVYVL